MHALAGFLPPLAISLPARFTAPALGRLEILFRAGPVLGDAGGVALSLPALQEGTWAWLQYRDRDAPARRSPIATPDTTARLPEDAPLLREGWLRLDLGGPATRFDYSVSPGALPYGDDAPAAASLRVSIHNGTGADVACSEIVVGLDAGIAPAEAGVAVSVSGTTFAVRADGPGTFVLAPVPPATGLARGETVSLILAGIAVEACPGPADLLVHETTDETRTTALTVERVVLLPRATA